TFEAFALRMNAFDPTMQPHDAQAYFYDGAYLAALAAVAGGWPVAGASMANGLPRVVGTGQPIQAGGVALNQAFQSLNPRGSINFDGASGPLDFDLTTGAEVPELSIYCVTSQGAFQSSGQTYANGQLSGTFTPCP